MRTRRHARVLSRLVVLVSLGICAPAGAQTFNEAMPVQSVTPADGAKLRADPFGVTFTVNAFNGEGGVPMELEVSRSRTLGADGTLANDLRLERLTLTERDSTPGSWRGTSRGAGFRWSRTRGTYYWQVSRVVNDFTTFPSTLHYYASSVYTLKIGKRCARRIPHNTFGLKRSFARASAAYWSQRCLGARRPSVSCRQDGNTSSGEEVYRCRVAWRRGGRKRSRIVYVFPYSGEVVVRPEA